MARTPTETGFFANRIPYFKYGSGPEDIIVLTGGPGNDAPGGMEAVMTLGRLRDHADRYTFWVTSRRQGQPVNYNVPDMAADTAVAIRETFPGGVAAIMGMSYGGLIVPYIAADHAGLTDKYVFIASAARISEEVKQADTQFAKHLAAGRNGRACAAVGTYLHPPGIRRAVLRPLMFLLGGLFIGRHHPDFANDVVNEGRAESIHDATGVLSSIEDEVLIIGGDSDIAFPCDLLEETAVGIRGSKLIVYEGRGHGGVTRHPSFCADVAAFLSS